MGTAQGRWVLAATVLGSSLAMLDMTVVNVALKRIGTDLDADFAGLQWTVNAYTLTLAALILLGGRSVTGSAGGASSCSAWCGSLPRRWRAGWLRTSRR